MIKNDLEVNIMTQQQEKLSAFMDGEIDGNEIIDAIKTDDEMQATWQRYHVIRSAMRKEATVAPQLDITASVAAALESEPAILAPKTARWKSIPVLSNVVPFAKQSGQFAVAASVAVAMIMGVQLMNQSAPSEPFTTAPTPTIQGGLSPVSLEQTRDVPSNDMSEVLERNRKINALIADHEQQVRIQQAQENNSADDAEEQDDRP